MPLRPIWNIMVTAKLDHSRVIVTTFHQNQSVLKGRSAGQKHTDRPVGFYGRIAPPGPNAPSSRICGQNTRNDADATFLDPHISVVNCHCAARYDRREAAGIANFKMYLLHQFS